MQSEEISEPGVKDFVNPQLGDYNKSLALWLAVRYDAPESLLGFPSIPKMSASVFRTSDRSTNGSSDVSVNGEKRNNKTKQKNKQKKRKPNCHKS